MSYIVRNCPAYSTFYPDTGDEPFTVCDAKLPSKKCQDCTDCVIKQVIEKCRDAKLECSCKNPNPDIDCFECTSGGRAELGQEILNMFDIEEVRE